MSNNSDRRSVMAQFEIAYHEGHEVARGNAHTLKIFVILRAFCGSCFSLSIVKLSHHPAFIGVNLWLRSLL